MASIRMWEVMKRAETGPYMEEKDFLMKHFLPTMKKVIKNMILSMIPIIQSRLMMI